MKYSEPDQEKRYLAFWAGTVGLYIVADKIEIITIQGDLPFQKAPNLNNKWWVYWKE